MKMIPATRQLALHQRRKTQNGALSSKGDVHLGARNKTIVGSWPKGGAESELLQIKAKIKHLCISARPKAPPTQHPASLKQNKTKKKQVFFSNSVTLQTLQ